MDGRSARGHPRPVHAEDVHEAEDPGHHRARLRSASGPHSWQSAGCRRARRPPTQYLTSAATTGDVTKDVAATGTVATTASYGLAFGAGTAPRQRDTPASTGANTWTVTERQGQGRRHRQEGRDPRDRRYRGPPAPAGRRRQHAPDREDPTLERTGHGRRRHRGRRRIEPRRSACTTPKRRSRPRTTPGEDLQTQIALATLKAPIDGVVTAVNVTTGLDGAVRRRHRHRLERAAGHRRRRRERPGRRGPRPGRDRHDQRGRCESHGHGHGDRARPRTTRPRTAASSRTR